MHAIVCVCTLFAVIRVCCVSILTDPKRKTFHFSQVLLDNKIIEIVSRGIHESFDVLFVGFVLVFWLVNTQFTLFGRMFN